MFNNAQINAIALSLPNLLHLLITLTSALVIIKISERAVLYVKTQYLILLLAVLGVPIIRANVSNVLPIFFLLELGTILFILLTLKGTSNSQLTKHKKNLVLILLPVILVITTVVSDLFFKECTNNLWFDVYKTTVASSEFVFWSIPLLSLQQDMLQLILFLIILATFIIIYLKSILPRNKKELVINKPDPILFIQNSFYFTKKNIITFFKPN